MNLNYKNYYDNNKKLNIYKNYKYDKYDNIILLKYWIIGFIIITLLYFLSCYCCGDETIYIKRFSPIHKQILRDITPAYPPPLVNFL
jgi:hypothetical protein